MIESAPTLEQVARAIHEAEFNPNNYADEPEYLWDNLTDTQRQTRTVQAQAALLKLRAVIDEILQ